MTQQEENDDKIKALDGTLISQAFAIEEHLKTLDDLMAQLENKKTNFEPQALPTEAILDTRLRLLEAKLDVLLSAIEHKKV